MNELIRKDLSETTQKLYDFIESHPNGVSSVEIYNLDPMMLHSPIDELEDRCLIRARYERQADGHWVHIYRVEGLDD